MRNFRPKIAIIGGGISGLGAAWHLADRCDVTLFEAEPRLGGHARTIMAGPNHDIPVDTGFMVFNERNYPHLMQLFAELDIRSRPTTMSFSVSLDGGAFEYGLTQPWRLFAQPTHALSPRFWRLLSEILRFNAVASQFARQANCPPEMSLGKFLNIHAFSQDLRNRYLYPIAGAIWSTSRDDMNLFPAKTLFDFFDNHGLLATHGQPQWRTVVGGSQVYVARMAERLAARGVVLRPGTAIEQVGKLPQPWVKPVGHERMMFDHVVLACHADQTLRLLDAPSNDETAILSAIRYRPNHVVLHGDAAQMPRRRAAWSSWVYRGHSDRAETSGGFTYWMNNLQHLPKKTPIFVTLNPAEPIAKHLIYGETTLYHPQFDSAAIDAQSRLPSIQGQHGLWYCGAWARYGFHEDGLLSAVQVAEQIAMTPS